MVCTVSKGYTHQTGILRDVVNFKTYRKSYKIHKSLRNSPDKYVIHKEVNTPIVKREDWETVQSIFAKHKRVPTVREPDIMQGWLYCADCGSKMLIRRRDKVKHPYCYYQCAGYNKKASSCTMHYTKRSQTVTIVYKGVGNLEE